MSNGIQFEPVPFDEAAKIVADRPVISREVFEQLLPEIRARAFLISGVEDMNVVQQVRDLIAEIPRGAGWEETKKQIVEKLGPWMDPEAADRRATLLMRHHGFQAYAATNYENISRLTKTHPYWKYLSMGDELVREAHSALHGLILPADDPFWKDHFPPWDWGCRCQVIPQMDMDYQAAVADGRVAGQKALPLDVRRRGWTLGPEALKALHNGKLDMGDGLPIDVRSPFQKATTAAERLSAYRWHPGDLRMDLDQLRAKYDAETFAFFEQNAKKTPLGDGRTVWEWMEGKAPGAKAAQAEIDFDQIREQKDANRAEGEKTAFEHAGEAAAKAAAQEEAARQAVVDDSVSGAKEFGSSLQKLDKAVGGSTGAFVAKDDAGVEYVVKTYAGRAEQVRNEYIANRLYAAAGIDVPEMRLAEVNGQLGIASKMLDKPKVVGLAGLGDAGKAAGIRKGFAADAWLGNWDVAGMEGDNVLKAGRRYYRVDQGGALLFRAQGTPKGAAFGTEVGELASLRDAAKNPAAAKLFDGLTDDEIAKQIRSLRRAVKPKIIAEIVSESGLSGDAADELQKTLAARLSYLGKWEHDFSRDKKLGLNVGGVVYDTASKLAENLERHWKLLTPEEKRQVKRYIGSDYREINADAWRHGRGVADLDSALRGKLPKFNGMTCRGMAIGAEHKLWKNFGKYASGEWAHAHKAAYTSSSVKPGANFSGNWKEFFIHKGNVDGGYIGKHGVASEDEYLSGRNSDWRVVGWGESPKGSSRFLVYEEIEPGEKVPVSQKPPRKYTYEEAMELWKKNFEKK